MRDRRSAMYRSSAQQTTSSKGTSRGSLDPANLTPRKARRPRCSWLMSSATAVATVNHSGTAHVRAPCPGCGSRARSHATRRARSTSVMRPTERLLTRRCWRQKSTTRDATLLRPVLGEELIGRPCKSVARSRIDAAILRLVLPPDPASARRRRQTLQGTPGNGASGVYDVRCSTTNGVRRNGHAGRDPSRSSTSVRGDGVHQVARP